MLKEDFITILKQRKLSVKKISDISGVSKTTISNWIYEIAIPTVDGMEKVLSALGYEVIIKK